MKNVQKKEDINGSPFNLAPASLENENSAQTNPVSHLVIETTSRRSDTATTMQQPEKEDETVVQSTLKETSKIPRETAMSVSMLSPAEWRVTQELQENNQDFTGVQHDRSSQKCQSGKLKKMRHEVTIDMLTITKQHNLPSKIKVVTLFWARNT